MFMVGFVILCLSGTSVRANVYATDVQINGSLRAGVLLPGSPLTITYILNDTASAGVSVRIFSGTNLVKSFSSDTATAGTNVGLNSIIWDGSTNGGTNFAASGAYTVQITAASAGYCTWTNITDDGTNFSVPVPRGIAVNQNTNSPYYGRIFVANTYTDYGIFKFNADGSPADEGGFSTGGLPWGGPSDKYSPWKMAISADDKVYIDDYSGDGVVYKFDQIISSSHVETAIGPGNYPTNDPTPQLSGLAVTGRGANTQIWMADENPSVSSGIIVWDAATNGVAAMNDPGSVVAPVCTNALNEAPYDIALDTNGYIYTIQFIASVYDPSNPLMRFPPYTGEPETNADWAVGGGDTNLVEAYGVAVNPAANLVALAVVGGGDVETAPTGGLYLFCATNGNLMGNIDETGGDPYYDVAWDAVGNLYALDGYAQVWRAYSPPGTNQSTTFAVPFIQVYPALTPPLLENPIIDSNSFRFTLAGQSNIAYVVQSSSDLTQTNWCNVMTNFSHNPNREIRLPACATQNFYRAVTTTPAE
jgi:hypothetical protein